MSVIINTNVAAISAQRHLGLTAAGFAQTVERLSSGLRINHAADDAAGLSISKKLESQLRGTAAAQRNAQDGISLLQTADGALEEVHSILERMRELAVQGANDTSTQSDRQAITGELVNLAHEIDAIGSQTTFNTKQLFNGPSAAGGLKASFQVGPDCGQTLIVDLTAKVINSTLATSAGAAGALAGLGAQNANVWTAFINSTDLGIASVSTLRATIGADQNRLESIARRLGVANENMASAESRIKDADMAAESVNLNRLSILQQAGIAVLAQANSAPNSVVRLLG